MKVLLIDLENCPAQATELLNDLVNYSRVVICYAQSGAKIPIDWLSTLTKAINTNKLKIIKMPNAGKNAADFGITFWAGVLMAKLPKKAHFDILSNDTDLDFVIDLLKSQKRSAARIGKAKKEAIISVPVESIKSIQEKEMTPFKKYCVHLAKHIHRPAKQDTLLNSIKSTFKNSKIKPDEILAELIKQGIVIINNNKVSYNQQQINTVLIEET